MVVKDLALEVEEEAEGEAPAVPSEEPSARQGGPLAQGTLGDGEERAETADPLALAQEEIERQGEVIAAQEGRIAQLEEALAGLQGDFDEQEGAALALKNQLEEAQGGLEALQKEAEAQEEQLALAVARYRATVLAASPDVPEELVVGTTVVEIDASLAAARQTVEKVRSRLRARASAERVPAGAPVRGAPDLSALSPKEKIALGLGRNR